MNHPLREQWTPHRREKEGSFQRREKKNTAAGCDSSNHNAPVVLTKGEISPPDFFRPHDQSPGSPMSRLIADRSAAVTTGLPSWKTSSSLTCFCKCTQPRDMSLAVNGVSTVMPGQPFASLTPNSQRFRASFSVAS